ncbi:MAG: helix-turn-helix domain-containing protein [Ilumatobacteraceae bacterium]|nr:helix-turn-helix domain-containing protein [Acidimicrobiaceae bacterium]MBP6489649.1 helix-turn-helix domain-containing protein [Ilumatobacteraceae bacterium]MBK9969457.1 helix-turn-helix domain-containing protein [Acidimicrobiaceae bacterium]MBP7888399.1 helix-turn-helix domain-containing protein [Ilumatobacteraceae bacterium]MBP8208236.1 helix-turn-helix domain-containing protein [Ilumatobacteraceae bacterium]
MPANSPSFTSTVSAITDAFGDPTRRGIYLFAREEAAGVTATQVAEKFGVHPNVARHHLDKLAAGGYLEVAVERAEGAGAGRPSKHYRVSADAKVDLTGDVPVHSDDLVLSLLGRALALLPHDKAEAMAEEVGQEYGLAMAQGLTGADLAVGQRSLRSAMQAVADALTAHGFAAHADQRNNQLRIVNNHCPFGDVAIEHPVICAVDRGMVKGMLTALYGATDVATMQSLPQGDTFCATSV